MNFMTFSAWIAALLFTAISYAGEPPIPPDKIAELMGYPPGILKVQETTAMVNEKQTRKNRPLVISAHSYTSDDGSFAPLYIAVGKLGSLLTPELKAKFDTSLATPSVAGPLRRIGDKHLGTGFVGIGMPGQGGEAHMSLLSLPSLGLDVQTILSVPEEMPAREGGEIYFAQIRSAAVHDLLETCALTTAEGLVARAGGDPVKPSLSAAPQGPEDKTIRPEPGHVRQTDDPDRAKWIWGIFGMLALIGLILFLRRPSTEPK